MGRDLCAKKGMVASQPTRQRFAQGGDLDAEAAARELGEDVRVRGAAEQRLAIVDRPKTPRTLVATVASLTPASSSTVWRPVASRWRSSICVLRCHVPQLSNAWRRDEARSQQAVGRGDGCRLRHHRHRPRTHHRRGVQRRDAPGGSAGGDGGTVVGTAGASTTPGACSSTSARWSSRPATASSSLAATTAASGWSQGHAGNRRRGRGERDPGRRAGGRAWTPADHPGLRRRHRPRLCDDRPPRPKGAAVTSLSFTARTRRTAVGTTLPSAATGYAAATSTSPDRDVDGVHHGNRPHRTIHERLVEVVSREARKAGTLCGHGVGMAVGTADRR